MAHGQRRGEYLINKPVVKEQEGGVRYKCVALVGTSHKGPKIDCPQAQSTSTSTSTSTKL